MKIYPLLLLNAIISQYATAVIVGAGRRGKELYVGLDKEEQNKIIAFFDNNENIQGNKVYDIPVKKPASLDADLYIISVDHNPAKSKLATQLLALGIDSDRILFGGNYHSDNMRLCDKTYLSNIVKILENGGLDKKYCPVCNNKLVTFFPVGQYARTATCPICASCERHRLLWLRWKMDDFAAIKGRVLHFAPEDGLLDKIRLLPEVDEYFPVDFNPSCSDINFADITNIPFADNSINTIICNHVLEHIPDDRKAMGELYRVLANDGIVFITIPISDHETTFEDATVNTPELREKIYGQSDHVRIYGQDFILRLKSSGFHIEEFTAGNNFSAEEIEKYGLANDILYICRK